MREFSSVNFLYGSRPLIKFWYSTSAFLFLILVALGVLLCGSFFELRALEIRKEQVELELSKLVTPDVSPDLMGQGSEKVVDAYIDYAKIMSYPYGDVFSEIEASSSLGVQVTSLTVSPLGGGVSLDVTANSERALSEYVSHLNQSSRSFSWVIKTFAGSGGETVASSLVTAQLHGKLVVDGER